MIHKLRKKFILINMMLVGAVLLVVFCAVCLSTHHRLREDSLNAMRQAVSYPFDEKFPHLEIGRKERRSKGKPMPMMPVFVVELAGDGSIGASALLWAALSHRRQPGQNADRIRRHWQ